MSNSYEPKFNVTHRLFKGIWPWSEWIHFVSLFPYLVSKYLKSSGAASIILWNISHIFEISGFPFDCVFYYLSDLTRLLQNSHPRSDQARDDTNLLSLMAAWQAVVAVAGRGGVVCRLKVSTNQNTLNSLLCSVTPHCLPAALAGWKLGKFSPTFSLFLVRMRLSGILVGNNTLETLDK